MIDRIEQIAGGGRAGRRPRRLPDELEQARVEYLGRKAELPNLLRGVAQLPPEERGAVGSAANEARHGVEAALARRARPSSTAPSSTRGWPPTSSTSRCRARPPAGRAPARAHRHTRRELEDVFLGLGFRVVEGPEVETVYYNFDALNHDRDASRAAVVGHLLRRPTTCVLRTHTSPMQVRAMELQPPPLYIVIPGRTYRRDNDPTHTPQFHQVEGLAVDEDITLADLQGTLLAFARAVFGDDREVRLRPHFFPFTEPSVELDVACFNCNGGFLRDGSRCPLCKGEGWIELLGAGEVDPNVFEYVRDYGYDPERHQGFAWGMGIERIAALKYGVPDLRLLYDNDLRLLGAVRLMLLPLSLAPRLLRARPRRRRRSRSG